MTLQVPTLDAQFLELVADLLALEPGMATSKDTVEGARLLTLALAAQGLYYRAKAIESDQFPAAGISTEALEKHAEVRFGPGPKKSATAASGADALRASGTPGAVVVVGDVLVHADGSTYQVTIGGTVAAGGTVDVSIEAVSTGEDTNKVTGEQLVFESPSAGITAEAVLVADLTGGADEETDAELLERLLHAFRNPPAGGRFSDYWAWAMTIDGVAAAYVYGPSSVDTDGRRGVGVVDVAVLGAGTGSERIPSAALVQAVQDYIDSVRPATTLDVLALEPDSDPENVDVQLELKPGYEWDWTGSGTVSSWTAGTLTITWTAALPSSLTDEVDAGRTPRIFVSGQVLTVTAYNGGSNETTVAETPSTTPSGTIYPGCSASAPALAAIKAYMDTLGPARGTAADPTQDWDDKLRVGLLGDACRGVTGVRDCTVVTPAADVTPTDHGSSGTVDVIVYGTITVRPT